MGFPMGTGTALFVLVANLFMLGAHSAPTTPDDFLKCLTLQKFNPKDVYSPKSANYTSILQSTAQNLRPATASKQKPMVILTPVNESEIQAAITCSKKLALLLKVRSGGHDYEGLSYASDVPFVIVDMRNFQSITVDTKEKTAWVQTGATLGQLYYTIGQKSKTLAFAAGVCPTIGIGGHLPGGGYGMISRKHGIAVDQILDAKLINANGQILDRKSMGEDLFWAIRGGGGTSFGIIVAFKVKLVDVPETVTVFSVPRTFEQNATQLINKWQHIADKIDDNLLIRVFLSTTAVNGKKKVVASFTSMFLGRMKDLMPIMQQKFPELGLVEKDCNEMSWVQSAAYFFTGSPNSSIEGLLNRTNQFKSFFKAKSDYVTQPIPERGLTGIWDFLNQKTSDPHTRLVQLQFSPYGGFLSNVSDSATPFPHRAGNIFSIHYGILWDKEGNADAENKLDWIRKLYAYMAPYVSKSPRRAYFNYRDLDIGSNNALEYINYKDASIWGYKYFNKNFDRLVSIKSKVDPSNFFRNEQSIPTR